MNSLRRIIASSQEKFAPDETGVIYYYHFDFFRLTARFKFASEETGHQNKPFRCMFQMSCFAFIVLSLHAREDIFFHVVLSVDRFILLFFPIVQGHPTDLFFKISVLMESPVG